MRLILDLGSGSLRSLARLGENFFDLTAVGVTPRHQDHVADLLPLLFGLRNSPGASRREPLTIFGYRGIQHDLECLAHVYGSWVLEPGFGVDVQELPPGKRLRLCGPGSTLEVKAFSVRHSPEAVAFRLQLPATFDETSAGAPLPQAVFAYSGDSGVSSSLVELAAGADLFVCECAFPDGAGVDGHLTPSELLPLCAASGARRVVATHFYPEWDARGVEAEWERALRRFEGDVALTPAHDGLRMDVGPPRQRG